MNAQDRIALELGRAIMRAHIAEAQLQAELAKNAELTAQLAKAGSAKPASRSRAK